MKKNLKFLFLTPCLFSVLCNPDDDICISDEPETYVVNVENVSDTYSPNETIWINAKVSSSLEDICDENNDLLFIDDNEVFLDGLFVLKLNNNLNEINAEVVTDAIVSFATGEAFEFSGCSEAIDYLPVLSDDNDFYEYRLGIAVDEPGDYCVVSSRDNNFNLNSSNNVSIFQDYNVLGDRILFESCGIVFARTGTEGHYFFRVQ